MAGIWGYQGDMRVYFDDSARIATEYPPGSPQGQQRPYTAAENAKADALMVAQADRLQRDRLTETALAIAAATQALAPLATSGGAWVQPTGATTAYAKDSKVTHGGKTWISLIAFNVWAPGVAGWRELVATGYPAWVQPTGSSDAYTMNAKVHYNGQNWENTGSNANVWAPGVFGWVVIP